MEPRKQTICDALRAWINQRPGLQFANYGDATSYRSELRSIARDKREAHTLLSAVERCDSLSADDLLRAFSSAFSGRLTAHHVPVNDCPTDQPRIVPGDTFEAIRLDYCTGQYWPTEYRKAAAAVCASALWDMQRRQLDDMESREVTRTFRYPLTGEMKVTEYRYGTKWVSAGDWLRASFRNWFGASIQKRWFN